MNWTQTNTSNEEIIYIQSDTGVDNYIQTVTFNY